MLRAPVSNEFQEADLLGQARRPGPTRDAVRRAGERPDAGTRGSPRSAGEQLAALYEDLVVVRRIDTEATALQRQGELGLWAPLLGQEAAQVGSARALRRDDFVFTSYRENAVAYCRGVDLTDLVRVWRGTAYSGWNPYDVGMATPDVIIGAQTLHATGYAHGLQERRRRLGRRSPTSATARPARATSTRRWSSPPASRPPSIFFCQNNQWAISEPVGLQARRADRRSGTRDSASRACASTATTCSP